MPVGGRPRPGGHPHRREPNVWLMVGYCNVGRASPSALVVGFMSLYAIWITHLAGWDAETPVEKEGG